MSKARVTKLDSEYAKSQRMKAEIRREKKLGFQGPIRRRETRGKRGNTIATIPVENLKFEQLELLKERMKLLPKARQVVLKSSLKQTLGTLLSSDALAKELIMVKPDVLKIALLCDPMGDKKR